MSTVTLTVTYECSSRMVWEERHPDEDANEMERKESPDGRKIRGGSC